MNTKSLLQKGFAAIGGKKIKGGVLTIKEERNIARRKELMNDVVELSLIQDFHANGPDMNSFNIINENFLNKVAVLLFYDPNCPYCKILHPTFAKLALFFKGQIPFGAVNIADEIAGNDVLADYFKINKIPTIYIKNKKYTMYNGLNDFESLMRYICIATGKCMAKYDKKRIVRGGKKSCENNTKKKTGGKTTKKKSAFEGKIKKPRSTKTKKKK